MNEINVHNCLESSRNTLFKAEQQYTAEGNELARLREAPMNEETPLLYNVQEEQFGHERHDVSWSLFQLTDFWLSNHFSMVHALLHNSSEFDHMHIQSSIDIIW